MNPEITFKNLRYDAATPKECHVDILLKNCDGNRRMFVLTQRLDTEGTLVHQDVTEINYDPVTNKSIVFDVGGLPTVCLFCGQDVTPEKTFEELTELLASGGAKFVIAEMTQDTLNHLAIAFYFSQQEQSGGKSYRGKSYRGKSRRRHGSRRHRKSSKSSKLSKSHRRRR